MSLSFLFHGAAISSFQLFNVAPITREKVFESLEEGVIVLNNSDMVVDYNYAMRELIPSLNRFSVGKPLQDILHKHPFLMELISGQTECNYQHLTGLEDVLYFRIRFSAVRNKHGQQIGKIISFLNVTERVKMEEKLTFLASIDGLI